MLELFATGEVMPQCRSPFEGSKLAEEREGGRFDLIHRLAAVGRAVGVVRIAQQQSRFHEEFHRVVANGFACVRCVADTVGVGDEINDGCDATKWSLRVRPCGIGLEVEQSEQRVGGSFVPLLGTELQSGESLDSFGESPFSGGGFAVGFSGGHEGAR